VKRKLLETNVAIVDRIAQATERLDNCTAALVNLTTLPDAIHVEALRDALPKVVSDLKSVLRSLGPADGWGLLPQILAAFLEASDAQRDELHAAVEAHDRERLARAAHRLRGAAANIGAEPLAEACAEVERLVATTSSDLMPELHQVDERLTAACAELEFVLAGRS